MWITTELNGGTRLPTLLFVLRRTVRVVSLGRTTQLTLQLLPSHPDQGSETQELVCSGRERYRGSSQGDRWR